MLKKSLVLFGMVAAFVGNAGAEAVRPQQDGEGCYLIGTADELEGFASIVNSANPSFTECAKLTADIHYLGNDDLLNSDRTDLRKDANDVKIVPAKQWTPLQNFAGTFDGQDYTIYGLYASSNATSGAAFIKEVKSAASSTPSIKNLHIADSYFNNTSKCPNGNSTCYASAGLVSVVSGPLSINKCSFSGVVASTGGETKGGGLIGSVVVGTSENVTIANSYNEGKVTGSGVIGDVASGNVDVNNCYNVGKASVSPLMGVRANQGQGINVSGTNLGCVGNITDDCNANFKKKNGTSMPVGTFVSTDPAAVIANFWSNFYGSNGAESIQAKIDELKDQGMAGLAVEMVEKQISYLDPSNNKQTITVSVPVAVIHLELSDEEEALVMPENLDVYGVKYDRTFSTGSSTLCNGNYKVSTTVLPFAMDVDNISGGKFYKPTRLYKEHEADQYWTIDLQEVSGNIEAHQPYVVCPTAAKIEFEGSTVVKQTNGVAGITTFDRDPEDPTGQWKFVGLYSNLSFDNTDPLSGRIYAFSGGEFVRAMSGSSKILRAYILAPEGSSPHRAPSVFARTAEVNLDESLSQLRLKVNGTDRVPFLRLDPSLVPPEVENLEEETSDEQISEGGETSEEDVVVDEESLRINRTLTLPTRSGETYWKDIKGRYMNRKPANKGVFLKNKVPVVVK